MAGSQNSLPGFPVCFENRMQRRRIAKCKMTHYDKPIMHCVINLSDSLLCGKNK